MTHLYYVFLLYEDSGAAQMSVWAYYSSNPVDFEGRFDAACRDLAARYGENINPHYGECCETFDRGDDDDILARYDLSVAHDAPGLLGPVRDYYDAPLPAR